MQMVYARKSAGGEILIEFTFANGLVNGKIEAKRGDDDMQEVQSHVVVCYSATMSKLLGQIERVCDFSRN